MDIHIRLFRLSLSNDATYVEGLLANFNEKHFRSNIFQHQFYRELLRVFLHLTSLIPEQDLPCRFEKFVKITCQAFVQDWVTKPALPEPSMYS